MLRRIGCRAHDYGKSTIESLATGIHDHGYQTIQFAIKKACEDVTDINEALTTTFANRVYDRLHEQSIDISVLGVYLNYAASDQSIVDKNKAIMMGHIKLAKLFGARMVGTETGSLNNDYSYTPDNHEEVAYQRFKEAVEDMLHQADKADTLIAVEAVAHHIIHTPKRMKRFIDDINHPRLKVICDITNMITVENYSRQDEIIDEMFDLLEDQIIAVHIKDFTISKGEKIIVPLGNGKLNMALLSNRIKASRQKIDVLAENVQKSDLKGMFWDIEQFFES